MKKMLKILILLIPLL